VDEALRDSVNAACGREDVLAAVRALYSAVQAEIDARRPVCLVSGRCCRFEEYGHRLFVTTAELATFVGEIRSSGRAIDPHPRGGAACPFQSNKMCTVHAIRPFGCRMFFCDATATEWQNEAYERFHAKLKRLHEELGVPYFYVEWRRALAALGVSAASRSF
jgi:Fe-S-cluster containining protein